MTEPKGQGGYNDFEGWDGKTVLGPRGERDITNPKEGDARYAPKGEGRLEIYRSGKWEPEFPPLAKAQTREEREEYWREIILSRLPWDTAKAFNAALEERDALLREVLDGYDESLEYPYSSTIDKIRAILGDHSPM